MGPAKRTLHDGIGVPSRPCMIVVCMSATLVISGWPVEAPPHTVVSAGTGYSGMTWPSGLVYATVPPSPCSPWQRAHPKPVGFSSEETWNHISPRSTDRAASSRSSSAFCPGSPSQITASHGAIRSMNATPRAMVRSMCWRSRTSSAGPGRIPGGMSGPRAAARRRMANMMRPPMNARATATPTISARVAAVDSARGVTSLAPDRHAERSLRLLLDRVGATRRTVDPRARVHADQAVLHDDPEPVHPARRRTVPVLPGAVVLRAMAGALEPLALDAEGHPAPEVDALLVQRHEAVADQALVDGVRLFALVRDQVEAAGPVVEGLVVGIDLLLDRVRGEVQVDHRSEPAAQVRPHERDAGRAELRGEQPHRGEQRPPEEVTPGDRRGPFRLAGRFGLGARDLPRGGLPENRPGLPRTDERPPPPPCRDRMNAPTSSRRNSPISAATMMMANVSLIGRRTPSRTTATRS